jgi:RNase P/RNase MRP subunit p29
VRLSAVPRSKCVLVIVAHAEDSEFMPRDASAFAARGEQGERFVVGGMKLRRNP